MSKKLIYLTSFVLMLGLAGKGWSNASNPSPDDGAIHEDTWLNLSWRPGDHAVSHNIYIGENYNDVNLALLSSCQRGEPALKLLRSHLRMPRSFLEMAVR